MEPLNEQPIEETTVSNTAKIVISATALIASFTAGTQLDSQQVQTLQDDNQAKVERITVLENEKQAIANEKAGITERYVYSQISSGRVPTIDSSMSLNDVQTAYKNIVGDITLSDTDLFKKGKEESIKRGDYICQ